MTQWALGGDGAVEGREQPSQAGLSGSLVVFQGARDRAGRVDRTGMTIQCYGVSVTHLVICVLLRVIASVKPGGSGAVTVPKKDTRVLAETRSALQSPRPRRCDVAGKQRRDLIKKFENATHATWNILGEN